jgi:hypothetical protein
MTGDYPDVGLWHLKAGAQVTQKVKGQLGICPAGQLVARPFAYGGAGHWGTVVLHGRVQISFHDCIRFRKTFFYVADLEPQPAVFI